MKKKSDKVLIALIFILGIAFLSWIIPQGAYNNGEFETLDRTRAGIFDVFVELCVALYSNYTEILYILIVGGCYGVLSKSKRY